MRSLILCCTSGPLKGAGKRRGTLTTSTCMQYTVELRVSRSSSGFASDAKQGQAPQAQILIVLGITSSQRVRPRRQHRDDVSSSNHFSDGMTVAPICCCTSAAVKFHCDSETFRREFRAISLLQYLLISIAGPWCLLSPGWLAISSRCDWSYVPVPLTATLQRCSVAAIP